MNVNEMAARARQGDADAFTELVAARKDNLYRIAYTYAKNQDDALDIVSEAVYKAYVSLNRLKNTEHFYTWLTRILINCAINHTRKSGQIVLTDASLNGPAQEHLSQEELIDLYSAIDRLEEKHRTVVILKYLSDLTVDYVAEVMECPVGTVKTYLHRALKELRLELKEV